MPRKLQKPHPHINRRKTADNPTNHKAENQQTPKIKQPKREF